MKSNVRYGMVMEAQTPTAVADLIARYVAVSGDPAMIDRYLAALAAVTPADVARVAREHLNERRRFVATLAHGPATGAGASAEGSANGAAQ